MRSPRALWSRAPRPAVVPDDVLTAAAVRHREVLAAAPCAGAWLIATRTVLCLVDSGDDAGDAVAAAPRERARFAWEDLDLADWSADEQQLTLVPSAPGSPPIVLPMDGVADLLRVLRERLSATLVLERHARLGGDQITAVCRRRPTDGTLLWRVRYSAGVDPDDPAVRRAAARLLSAAREELGDSSAPSAQE